MTVPIECIRNAARAVIVRNDQVLLLRKEGGGLGERYALPGGAQELGETLEASLQRECLEEIGSEVKMLSLLHVADYFKPRDTTPPSTRQLIEFLFLCEVPQGYQPGNGPRPDKHQVAVEWMALDRLPSIILQPRRLRELLQAPGLAEALGVYLGVID
jgi:ADP-ribose pyrophosphatase YjhB (NUDIX family)